MVNEHRARCAEDAIRHEDNGQGHENRDLNRPTTTPARERMGREAADRDKRRPVLRRVRDEQLVPSSIRGGARYHVKMGA